MINKHYLEQLLSEGRTRKLIKEMLASKYFKESDDYSDILHQSSRLGAIEQDRNKGVIENAQYFLELNRINAALNVIISKIPNDLELELENVTKQRDVHKSIRSKMFAILLAAILLTIGILTFTIPKFVQKTFPLSVIVETLPMSGEYPPLEDATLALWDGAQFIKAPIQSDGVADFKSISTDLIGKNTRVKMQAVFWKLASDSIVLFEKNVIVKLVPDGSLGLIHGEVRDKDSKKALEGVELTVVGKGVKTFSDKDGKFEMTIPLEKQEKVYQIIAIKNGYADYNPFINPQQSDREILLSKNKKNDLN